MAESAGHAEIGGVRISGQILGSGPPLLLLHGLAGSWAEWRPSLQALAQHFKVYVPTMPGHGDSGPIPDYSLESSRRLFLAFLESEHLAWVNLAGHSMGGLLALDLALNFPDRVGKLVLIGSAGLGSQIHWGVRLLTLPIVGEVILDFLWPRLGPHLGALARYAGLPVADASVQEKTRKPGGSMARLLRTGVDIRGQRLWPLIREQLPNLRAPTLIIWGERDELFPVSQAREACRLIPNARLYILPKCGHIPGEEDAEKINAVLIDFLLDPKRNA